MEVEIREEANPRTQHDTTSLLVNNTPAYPLEDQPELIVRAEEILLVVLVLMLWVAAITMFFNRWGQIRTLEPYQPKFQQNHHRSSCPLAPLSPPHITPQVSSIQVKQQNSTTSQRMSFSKYNVNCFTDSHVGLTSPANLPPHRRPRLNSVFVAGSSAMAVINTPPRRVKSAIDIHHLIINEKQYRKPSLSGGLSLLPITSMYRERKPSIVIERLANNKHQLYNTRRRPSMVMIDRPMLSHYNYPQRNRKASCFIDRRHKNFISFDQSERKLSIALDNRSSLSSDYQQPSISFDTTPSVSFESPTVIIEHAEINHHHHHHSMKTAYSPKFSRSLEQPGNRIEKLVSPRISLSLDTHANVIGVGCDSSINSSMSSDEKPSHGNMDAQESVSFDKESSTSVEEIKDTASVTISFEDAAPLLEELKSSDV